MRDQWFFFYGTLSQDHDNAMTRALLPLLEGGRQASVRGRLRAVHDAHGWYPVLCAGAARVFGRLYRGGSRFRLRHLRMLDAYEGFDRRRPGRSEYVRRKVRVQVGGARLCVAETYCFNRPVHPGQRVIATGNFVAFSRRTRLPVFAPADRPRIPRSPALPTDAPPSTR